MRLKSYTGQKIGYLTVLKKTGEKHGRQLIYQCKCDCGNTVNLTSGNLSNKKNKAREGAKVGCSRTCGLRKFHGRPGVELAGQRFGALTAIEPTDQRQHKFVVWRCKCDCGEIREVRSNDLRQNHTVGCHDCMATMEGKRYGLWTVVEDLGDHLLAKCHCGKSDCLMTMTFKKSHLYNNQEKRCWHVELRGKWGPVVKYKIGKSLRPVEEIRQDPSCLEILQVKCAYCGQWFGPTYFQYQKRRETIEGKANHDGECRFYCSDACKIACPIYKQKVFPKDYHGKQNSSREVQPELRQIVLERDNWTCQKCEAGVDAELHCHHLEGIRWNPLESADIDMCITYCKDCHREAHSREGCKTSDMVCK